MSDKNLPRLLYVGDVPVASTIAGAALLYRLLQNYPTTHLRIVEGNLWSTQQHWSSPDKRLQGVDYKMLRVGSHRLLCSRFTHSYAAYLQLVAPLRSRALFKTVEEFQPEAILTVAHGFSWLTASTLAKRCNLPLHLIVHDDWPSCNPLPQSLQEWAQKQFRRIYRQAQTRFCVSPYMEKLYEDQFGVAGTVLYPTHAADDNEWASPHNNLRAPNATPVFAYAGTINSQGYGDGLSMLATALESVGGHLVIYSPLTSEAIKRLGLNKSNISVHPTLPYKELLETLNNSVDVLFVPMSFDIGERRNMEVSFPSKLTDYTAVGLPMLIWGPAYCSAVRWADENPGVAEVVREKSCEALTKAVIKLSGDVQYRSRLGAHAKVKGEEYFSHTAAAQQFYQAIN